jgi:hypothetical protein
MEETEDEHDPRICCRSLSLIKRTDGTDPGRAGRAWPGDMWVLHSCYRYRSLMDYRSLVFAQ